MPWTSLWRIWRAWSRFTPPPELQQLLDHLADGYSLYLYLRP